jgi:hypothetical protein
VQPENTGSNIFSPYFVNYIAIIITKMLIYFTIYGDDKRLGVSNRAFI